MTFYIICVQKLKYVVFFFVCLFKTPEEYKTKQKIDNARR